MKRLLLLSYYFPPLGMGGTQRAAKLAKYLPQFGWDVTVLTIKPIAYWAEDKQLLQELQHIRIVRTESLDPQRLLRRWRKHTVSATDAGPSADGSGRLLLFFNHKVLPFFLLPDSKILWTHYARKEAKKILQSEHYDAVFSTSPPHSVHLIGRKIASRHSLKWVADFRDEWSGGVVVHEPTPLQRWLNRRWQKSVVQKADAVISVTPGIERALRIFDPENEGKFHLIPNGFDRDDFPHRPGPKKGDRFVFCHCGSITRFSNPEPFLKGFALAIEKHPQLRHKVSIRFVGYDATGVFPQLVSALGLDSFVEYIGYQTHRQALQYLMQADALVLIALGKEQASFIPGKTFEYIAAQKPILAISNVRDTLSFLQKLNLSVIQDKGNFERIASRIKDLVDRPQPLQIDQQLLAEYDRRNQAQKLAAILNELTKND